MQMRHVGRSGLKVTTVGLGCNNLGWTIDQQASNSVVARALDLGVNLFDTADRYGRAAGDSEVVLGKALDPAVRDCAAQQVWCRAGQRTHAGQLAWLRHDSG